MPGARTKAENNDCDCPVHGHSRKYGHTVVIKGDGSWECEMCEFMAGPRLGVTDARGVIRGLRTNGARPGHRLRA